MLCSFSENERDFLPWKHDIEQLRASFFMTPLFPTRKICPSYARLRAFRAWRIGSKFARLPEVNCTKSYPCYSFYGTSVAYSWPREHLLPWVDMHYKSQLTLIPVLQLLKNGIFSNSFPRGLFWLLSTSSLTSQMFTSSKGKWHDGALWRYSHGFVTVLLRSLPCGTDSWDLWPEKNIFPNKVIQKQKSI